MKKLFLLFLIIIAAFVLAMLWWNNGISPVNPNDKTAQIFVVPKGTGIREIANKLKAKNLIKDPIVFFLLLKKNGLDKKIEAGDFRLNPSMTALEIAQSLTHGTLDIWVTVPEGKRAEEVLEILKDKMPGYKSLWQNKLSQNEGFLFPDTYLIPRTADIDLIINLMRKNFANKYLSVQVKNQTQLSQNDIIIIASLVEREAKFSEDRPLVASVIHNRLGIGMKLDIDATVQYALGYSKDEKTWWRKNLTIEDLEIKSLYNTYKNAGLPPTPIANPGLDAISAVINAPKTDYLYYISDKKGHLHFAKNIDGHNENVKKYIP